MIRIGSGTYIVKIAAIVAVSVYILQMLEMGSVVSVLFAFSIICVAVSYVLKCIQVRRVKVADLAMFAIVVLAIVKAGIGFEFDYYKPAIIVLCCVLCIDLCPDMKITGNDRKLITNSFIAAAVITNYLYYFAGLRHKTFGSTKYISLNMSNPNETGMWLSFIIIILVGACFAEKTKKKYILGICGLSLIPILIATGSRSNLIAVFVFVSAMVLNRIRKLKAMPKWFIWMVALAPALLFFFYMEIFIPNLDFFQKIFAFITAEGKNLTSRVGIWSIVEKDLAECFFLGKYEYYFSEQMHNSLATLYGRFGVFFVAIIYKKFALAIMKIGEVTAQWAMTAVWLVGCFETSFLGGMAGIYMLILVLPRMTSSASNDM